MAFKTLNLYREIRPAEPEPEPVSFDVTDLFLHAVDSFPSVRFLFSTPSDFPRSCEQRPLEEPCTDTMTFLKVRK